MELSINPSDEQRKIIYAERRHALVDAGAGVGKSTTIALRGAHLIRDLGVPSESIFALSYSRLSAAELSDRFLREVEGGDKSPMTGAIESPVGTFHSIFLRLLKSYRHGFRKYEVEGETSRHIAVRRYYRWLGVDAAVGNAGLSGNSSLGVRQAAAREERKRKAKNVTLFLNLIDRVREECVPPGLLPPPLREGLGRYQRLLRTKAIWDHSQLLEDFLDELTPANQNVIAGDDNLNIDHGALRAHLARTLREVLADEAQDANHILWNILGQLRDLGANVWAIGDLDQLVYAWRGSDPRSFARFSTNYPDAHRFALTSNYRCSPGILTLASDFIDGEGLLNRDAKRLTASGHQQWDKGDIAVCRFGSQSEQYAWVAKRIKQMLGTPFQDRANGVARGLAPSDFAIIFRKHDSTAGMAAALRAEGLEPAVRGELDLLVPLEAQALATAVYFMANLVDEDEVCAAFLKADIGLNMEAIKRAIEVLNKVRARAATEQAERRVRQEDNESTECGVRGDNDVREGSKKKSGPVCLIRVLQTVLSAAGFSEEFLRVTTPHRSADAVMLHLARVFKAVSDYQRWHYRDPLDMKLHGLANWLRDEADDDCRRGDGGSPEDGTATSAIPLMTAPTDAVTLTTCHSCKGLQWAAVFVIDVAEGWLPMAPREDKRFWNVLPKNNGAIADPERYDGSYDDEARLFYVSLTRAAKFLSVTYAPAFAPPRKNAQWKSKRESKPAAVSRYLNTLEGHEKAVTALDFLPSSTTRAMAQGTMLPPESLRERKAVTLTFSQLYYYFLCPYQFKMRFVYGFVPPVSPFLGYPKSLHDAAAEMEKRASTGEQMGEAEFAELAIRHLRMPFASQEERESRTRAAAQALSEYARCYRVNERGGDVEFIEREVRLDLGDLVVLGRIDRSYVGEDGNLQIDELKTTREAVERDTELLQLQTYAAAYQSTTGVLPDKVGVRLIGVGGDEQEQNEDSRVAIDEDRIRAVRTQLKMAGTDIAGGLFPPAPNGGLTTCRKRCDVRKLCGWYQQQVAQAVNKAEKLDEESRQ